MKIKKICLRITFTLAFFSVLLISIIAYAAPLENVPVTLTQPNGVVLHCLMSGDEYFNYYHDADGNFIIQNVTTGYYTYAKLSNGKLVASSIIVPASGIAPKGVAGLVKKDSFNLEKNKNAFLRQPPVRKTTSADTNKAVGRVSTLTSGTMNEIVIFIRFSDESEFMTGQRATTIKNMFTASTRSLKSYMSVLSNKTLTVDSAFYPHTSANVVYSFQSSHPRGYYMPYNASSNPIGSEDQNVTWNRGMELLASAVNAVKNQIPTTTNIDKDGDGYVDDVCFVLSGQSGAWSTFLWPHMSTLPSGSSINGKSVGSYNLQLEDFLTDDEQESVLCHETMHVLGFPDLYHYGNTSADPMGSWDIMDRTTTPPQYSNTYSREFYGGWSHTNETVTIKKGGRFTLYPVTSSTGTILYKIPLPYSDDQFIMLEYRKSTTSSYESALPGSGLIIYRVNTNLQNIGDIYGPPDEVYVFRPGESSAGAGDGTTSSAFLSADIGRTSFGSSDISSNLYVPGSIYYQNGVNTGIVISNVSTAGSTISFTVTLGFPKSSPDSVGSGTLADPYLIHNVAELNMVRGYIRAGWNLSKHYKLVADIDLSNYGLWTPFGNNRDFFDGSFDGGGHTIKGMKTTSMDVNEIDENVGLFSHIGPKGSVTNLKLIDFDSYGDPSHAYAAVVGGIAGINYGKISYCYVNGTVRDGDYVGGIAGMNGLQVGVIVSAGKVKLDQSKAKDGMIDKYSASSGYSSFALDPNRQYYGEISNCYADVKVKGIQICITVGYAGGIAGSNEHYGSIRTSAANVNGTAVDGAGGVVAYNAGLISDVAASGHLETTMNGGSIAGECFYGTIQNSIGLVDVIDLSGHCGAIGTSTGLNGYNLYYDKQVCSFNSNDISTPLKTSELTNGVLPAGLSSSYWEVKAGFYPRVKLTGSFLRMDSIPVFWGSNTNSKIISRSFTLPAIDREGHSVKWTSSNPAVIKISGSTAIKCSNGTIMLTAKTTSGVSSSCKTYTVSVSKPVSSITLNKKVVILGMGESFQMTAKVSPLDTIYQKVYWSTSNSWVAYVEPDGLLKHNIVHGNVTIRAIAMDGCGVYAECSVIEPSGISNIVNNGTTIQLGAGDDCGLLGDVYCSGSASGKVLVYNVAGKLVSSTPFTISQSGTYTFHWNGKATAGNEAGIPAGNYVPASIDGINYTMKLFISDQYRSQTSSGYQMKVCCAPPTLSKVALNLGGTFLINGTNCLNITGTVSSQVAAKAKATIYDSNNHIVASVSSTGPVAGSGTLISWNGRATTGNGAGLAAGSVVPKGEYKVKVTVSNCGGSTVSGLLSFSVNSSITALSSLYATCDGTTFQSSPKPANTVTIYSIQIPYNASDTKINAVPSDINAKVDYTGTFNFMSKATACTIRVTSQSGTVKTYTLKATWVAEVQFDTKGGNTIAPIWVTYNSTIPAPATPVRTGYTFLGWYKEAACINSWNFTAYPVTAEIKLYAKWKINTYTVTFNSQGGSAIASKSIVYNKTISAPASPTRAGYAFSGWYKDSACKNLWNFTSDRVVSNMVLYAKWLVKYTISTTVNNSTYGSTSGADVYASGTSVTVKAIPKPGYRFVRWLAGTTTVSSSYAYSFTATKNRTLKAEFALIGTSTITSAASANGNSIKLIWTAVAGASGYEIWRATSSGGTYTKVKSTTAGTLTFTDTGLTTNKTYYFRIKAFCVAGTVVTKGRSSAYKSAKPISLAPAIHIPTTSIMLDRKAVIGASGYKVWCCPTSCRLLGCPGKRAIRYLNYRCTFPIPEGQARCSALELHVTSRSSNS